MIPKPRPKTEFPSPNVATVLAVREKRLRDKHLTRFPGGQGLKKLLTSETNELPVAARSKKEQVVPNTSLSPLKVNPPDAISSKPLLSKEKIEAIQGGKPSRLEIKIKNPWDSYTAHRLLQRGGETTAACTKAVPIKMVAIQKISSDHFKEMRTCQHENLLAILETYRYGGQFFVITDYTATTLRHIIAIPLPLQELHVSATCRQVFSGMQYLSRFGIAHKNLDGSRVLFLSDGCVKIAHFDDCQSTESASAYSLGVIAMEMMQKGISPMLDQKLVLESPKEWSPEASNFLGVASWATLKEIQDILDVCVAYGNDSICRIYSLGDPRRPLPADEN